MEQPHTISQLTMHIYIPIYIYTIPSIKVKTYTVPIHGCKAHNNTMEKYTLHPAVYIYVYIYPHSTRYVILPIPTQEHKQQHTTYTHTGAQATYNSTVQNIHTHNNAHAPILICLYIYFPYVYINTKTYRTRTKPYIQNDYTKTRSTNQDITNVTIDKNKIYSYASQQPEKYPPNS
jgi:hypothetical protein